MNFIYDIISHETQFQIIAGLVGILSMIVARLLDWYFPSEHHRKLREEEETRKELKELEKREENEEREESERE